MAKVAPRSPKRRTPAKTMSPTQLPGSLEMTSNGDGSQISAVMAQAELSGLLAEKSGRIAGRVSLKLIAQAKARTGLTSDTELVEFALANLALEDDFADVFWAMKGTVGPDLDLGY